MSLRFFIDGIIAFIVLGISEAIVKPLAKAAIERPLKQALPAIFEKLDDEMPKLLITATPEVMTSKIASTIASATGNEATARQIEKVVELYSPIKAAFRNRNFL